VDSLASLAELVEALKLKKSQYYNNKDVFEEISAINKELRLVTKKLADKENVYQNCQSSLAMLHKKTGSLEEQIKSMEEESAKLQSLQEEYDAYDLFMQCMHSNGIAYSIIKSKLPILNLEVAKILSNIVDFDLTFNSEGKKLDILIKHENKKSYPIEMGSGAEQTAAAVAIRLALIKIGTLPISNIIILDEPATAFDEKHMEKFISLLEIIKTQFETVYLISHLEILKDTTDKQIIIENISGDAKVEVN